MKEFSQNTYVNIASKCTSLYMYNLYKHISLNIIIFEYMQRNISWNIIRRKARWILFLSNPPFFVNPSKDWHMYRLGNRSYLWLYGCSVWVEITETIHPYSRTSSNWTLRGRKTLRFNRTLIYLIRFIVKIKRLLGLQIIFG